MLLVRIGALAGFKAGTRTGAGGGGAQAVLCWPTVGPARCKWQQALGSRVWAGGAPRGPVVERPTPPSLKVEPVSAGGAAHRAPGPNNMPATLFNLVEISNETE